MKNTIISKALFFLAAAAISMNFTTSRQAGGWEKLGERKVNYGLDRDEIAVTAAEGTFTAIQLHVKRGGVNMHKLVVNYGNGEHDEIEVRDNFRPGSKSRVIDLPGNRRIIRSVVFWYDTKNIAARRAVVELWGRH